MFYDDALKPQGCSGPEAEPVTGAVPCMRAAAVSRQVVACTAHLLAQGAGLQLRFRF